jgi:DNA primase
VLLGLHRAVPIDDRVTIAEGTFSCLALERAGWPNVLGLLGSDVMGGRGISTRLHILAHYDGPFFVVTDPDSAGDRVAEALHVLDGLSGQRRDVIRVRLSQSPDDCAFDELRDERRKYVDRTTRLS